jgi:hypothetical protein
VTRQETIAHEFVEFIPDDLADGILYISITYATATHLCCCGCGFRVVTPLNPAKWKLIFEGIVVSLNPSIGNWSSSCQSHYWVERNKVIWSRRWSKDEIAEGRCRDQLEMDDRIAQTNQSAHLAEPEGRGFWSRVRSFVRRGF